MTLSPQEIEGFFASTSASLVSKGNFVGNGGFGSIIVVQKKGKGKDTTTRFALKIQKQYRHAWEEHKVLNMLLPEKLSKKKLHPNVIKVETDAVMLGGPENLSGFIMELVTGGDLNQKINTGTIPIDWVKWFFFQLISGIEYIHSCHIMHGDIKSENIFLTENNVLKIGDFGSAKHLLIEKEPVVKLKQVDSGFGTIQFCAPEVLPEDDDTQQIDGFPCDVWGVGVVLMHMLIGDLPWVRPDKEDPGYRRWKKQTKRRVKWADIEEDAETLLRKILVEDVKTRATIEEIKFDTWLAGVTRSPSTPLVVIPFKVIPQVDDLPTQEKNNLDLWDREKIGDLPNTRKRVAKRMWHEEERQVKPIKKQVVQQNKIAHAPPALLNAQKPSTVTMAPTPDLPAKRGRNPKKDSDYYYY